MRKRTSDERATRHSRHPEVREMPPSYDPELPAFYELRQLIVAQAERELAAEQHLARHWRRRRQRAAPVKRVTGRAAVLAALLVVIASSAWGTSAILRSPGPPGAVPSASRSQPLLARSGDDGEWRLRVWRAQGQLCDELLVAGQESSECVDAPARLEIRPLRVNSPARQYAFGLTGPAVAAVEITAEQHKVHTPTRRLADARASGTRWFLTSVARPVGDRTPRLRVRRLQR